MLKVAILDDYQNVSQQFVDLEKLAGKYEIKIFSEPFEDEADALDKLADFEALLIMREEEVKLLNKQLANGESYIINLIKKLIQILIISQL